ncbi:MAG: hypothetical protein JXR34_04755 [Bacteroidales bacterium]|nr:hypothetical protein [Bacteroidales bacterium]
MKFNIDQLFKNKLSEINYDFKSEYWQEMEKMLAEKAPVGGSSSGGFFNSFGFKAAIFTSTLVTLSIVGHYFSTNNDSINAPNYRQTEETISAKKADPCNELLTPLESNTVSTHNYNFNLRMPYQCDAVEYLMEKEQPNPNYFRPFNIEDYTLYNLEELIIPDPNVIVQQQIEEKNHHRVVQKSEEPKNVKPMEKTVKHVFKKKGLLYYLGIKP